MGVETEAASIVNAEESLGFNSSQFSNQSGGIGGGDSGQGGRDGMDGQRRWAGYQELARSSSGSVITRVTVGTEGYTLKVHDNIPFGDGKITGHKDGTLHRHGYMSAESPRSDFIRSNLPHQGIVGNIIGKSEPEA